MSRASAKILGGSLGFFSRNLGGLPRILGGFLRECCGLHTCYVFGKKRGKSGNSEKKPMSRASARVLGGSLGFAGDIWGLAKDFARISSGMLWVAHLLCFLGKSEENQETARKSL